jgi:hypothetical protein
MGFLVADLLRVKMHTVAYFYIHNKVLLGLCL